MRIGYSYWGFLGDKKYNDKGDILSTPDGNAFYSWSIINKLQQLGHVVLGIMPDRDEPGFRFDGPNLFDSWCTSPRLNSYIKMQHCEYGNLFSDVRCRSFELEKTLFTYWDFYHLNEFDVILHEWRMPIEGRNTLKDINSDSWQPDLFIQDCLIRYCIANNVKLVIFDLDYKIDEDTLQNLLITNNVYVFELGNKWKDYSYSTGGRCRKVYIPFDFRYINQFSISDNVIDRIVYVGNRYERDWCIDKYLVDVPGLRVYGNWLESNRDSVSRWPGIQFGKRLQTSDMHKAYSNAATTILLAKKDYCEHSFMTARIIEAIFYGSVPLFIEEYGEKTISKYAGMYIDILTVKNNVDVAEKSKLIFNDKELRKHILEYLRVHLEFMDVDGFVKQLINIAGEK